MTTRNLLKELRKAVDERCIHKGRIRNQGCTVRMTDVPHSRLVIDLDKPGSPLGASETRCDYFVVVERDSKPILVVPLELQKGKLDAGKVFRQLKAGARALEKIISKHHSVSFLPVAACRSSMRQQRNALKANNFRIRLHNHDVPVEVIKCGSSLADANGFWS